MRVAAAIPSHRSCLSAAGKGSWTIQSVKAMRPPGQSTRYASLNAREVRDMEQSFLAHDRILAFVRHRQGGDVTLDDLDLLAHAVSALKRLQRAQASVRRR